MKLKFVEIENYRGIDELQLPIHPSLTVLHGDNAHGKTSVLSAIAAGLGMIPRMLPGVSGINLRKADQRVSHRPMRVCLTTTEGIGWRRGTAEPSGRTPFRRLGFRRLAIVERTLREEIDAIVNGECEGHEPKDLPIVVFYDTERAISERLPLPRGFGKSFPRFTALEGALSARANFRDFAEWFYAWENEELREQKERRDFGYRLKELDAVRSAITSMVPGASGLHIKHRPLRIMLSFKPDAGDAETLSLNQLSDGYRIVLAVAGDLARRMAHGNPHLTDPLVSEAIVLIDEIELHLHPSWQQRILSDLTRTFPNAQFIVSTHSPQVLTTLHPKQIVKLSRENGHIVAGRAPDSTYGAEAGDVLNVVMGVDERPPNEFAQTLKRYMRLIGDDHGESREAKKLRRELERWSPHDPALATADLEIRRRKLFARMGTSK